jgi:prepilin-type N-terminal cleavage/methylation domain-containing protein
MNPERASRFRGGFTLIELLVSVAIIVVLAVLVFTLFRRTRASADRAVATANLRQLQFANFNYANDHNGAFVPISSRDQNNNRVRDWHEPSTFMYYLLNETDLDPDVGYKTVPAGLLDPVVVRAKKSQWKRLYSSYGYNEVAMPGSGPSSDKRFRISQLTDATRTVAFATATDWVLKYPGRFLWLTNPVEGKSTDGKLAFRHGNIAIVTYYDGSTGAVSPEDLRRIDREGGINHPFWKADFRTAP